MDISSFSLISSDNIAFGRKLRLLTTRVFIRFEAAKRV